MQEPVEVTVVQLPSAIGQNTLFIGFKLHRGQTVSPVNPKIWKSEFPNHGKIQGEGKLLHFTEGYKSEAGRQCLTMATETLSTASMKNEGSGQTT